MAKIFVVEACYDYEGFEIIHVASTKELAEQWRNKYFEKTFQQSIEYWQTKNKSKYFGSVDNVGIEEFTIDND